MFVTCIAYPKVNWDEMGRWLTEIGASEWMDRVALADQLTDAEAVAEAAGRRCYNSFTVQSNPNVKKIRTDSAAYLANIINSKHGSVLEHLNYTFAVEGVSRVLTHELVRHRAGTAVSQESGRYVRLTRDIPFDHASVLEGSPALLAEAQDLLEHMGEFQEKVSNAFDLNDGNLPFAIKKQITSAMRRYAPEGRRSGLVWSANVRALRHIIETRSHISAESEIREFAQNLGEIMVERAPLLFADFEIDEEGQWVPQTSKV